MGSVYRKLADTENAANAWGPWDPRQYTVEDSAFGFITMKNGATVVLEASWALNSLEIDEAKTTLCGTRAGADMKDGLRINGEEHSQLYVKQLTFDPGGAAFYAGETKDPADLEAESFFAAIENDTDPLVLPEQALMVTRVLEAIYASAKSGKPIYFD